MTGISFSITKAPRANCEGCGREFVKTTDNQRVCRKNCGRVFKTKRVQFVGVDGEGSDGDASKYVLFGVGKEHVENRDGLDWKTCFDFLYRQFQRYPRNTAFVGFFLGYDFTQILKGLPEDRARMLFTAEGRAKRRHTVANKAPHPVLCDEWEFDLLGNKRLRIRPHECVCRFPTCEHPKSAWCYLCDVGPYWQTSFLNVIKPENWETPICTPEEYEKVRIGKENRSSAVLGPEMREYMHLEIDILERAMSVLGDGFESIGIHLPPSKWFGPGQASATWMKGKVPPREQWIEAQPDYFLEAARMSYFGGWFELFCHGRVKGTSYEYDLNSAYPATIKSLPCLMHGTWSRGSGNPRGGEYCLVKARVSVPGFKGRKPKYIGSMLHRDKKGTISRPAMTEGWFWWTELQAAIRAKCVDPKTIEYYEWANYEPCSCPPPFKDIEGLYTKRLEVGKDSPLGKSSKLVYNAGYGKFAQSVGEPQFGNPIYASKITSKTRERILDAIATHPKKQAAVLMVATDAIFFMEPHPTLPISDALGEWGMKEKHNLTLFKPGMYWDDAAREMLRKKNTPKFKARGVNAAQFAERIWSIDFEFAQWNDTGFTGWPQTSYESGFSMVTCLQALQRNDWSLAGRNTPRELLQDSNPFRKRSGIPYLDSVYNVWRTDIPWPEYNFAAGDWNNVISHPYEKRFGLDDPWSDETKEAFGITEDGTLGFVYKQLLDPEEE